MKTMRSPEKRSLDTGSLSAMEKAGLGQGLDEVDFRRPAVELPSCQADLVRFRRIFRDQSQAMRAAIQNEPFRARGRMGIFWLKRLENIPTGMRNLLVENAKKCDDFSAKASAGSQSHMDALENCVMDLEQNTLDAYERFAERCIKQ